MRTARRRDVLLALAAVLLLIDVSQLPWHTTGGGTVSGIVLPSPSDPATGPPDGLLGTLAALALVVLLVDLALERFSPQTRVPAPARGRTMTRLILAALAALFLFVKFILHVDEAGNLGAGFWVAIPLAAVLVVLAARAVGASGPAPGGEAP